jgi:hypothetical protein
MLENAVLPSHKDADPNDEGVFIGDTNAYVCSIILNDDYEGW